MPLLSTTCDPLSITCSYLFLLLAISPTTHTLIFTCITLAFTPLSFTFITTLTISTPCQSFCSCFVLSLIIPTTFIFISWVYFKLNHHYIDRRTSSYNSTIKLILDWNKNNSYYNLLILAFNSFDNSTYI